MKREKLKYAKRRETMNGAYQNSEGKGLWFDNSSSSGRRGVTPSKMISNLKTLMEIPD